MNQDTQDSILKFVGFTTTLACLSVAVVHKPVMYPVAIIAVVAWTLLAVR